MCGVPDNRMYTATHEWLIQTDGIATVGVTAHGADLIGDVVYVVLPEVGEYVSTGASCGEIETPESVWDLNAPAAGAVTEVNTAVIRRPELVNQDPYGQGWLFKSILVAEPQLLSAQQYSRLVELERSQ